MGGETLQMRNILRHLKGISDGNSYVDTKDEKYRRAIGTCLLGMAAQVNAKSSEDSYNKLADVLLRYRVQLIEPEKTFLTGRETDKTKTFREDTVNEFLVELCEDVSFNLENYIIKLNRIADEMTMYLKVDNFITSQDDSYHEQENAITLSVYHDQRHQMHLDFFHSHHMLLEFLFDNRETIVNSGLFRKLPFSRNFESIYEHVFNNTPFVETPVKIDPKDKVGYAPYKRFLDYANDPRCVRRCKERMRYLDQWRHFKISDETKLNFIKAHFTYHQSINGPLKSVKELLESLLKESGELTFSDIVERINTFIGEGKVTDVYSIKFLRATQESLNKGTAIYNSEAEILRSKIKTINAIIEAAKFTLIYYKTSVDNNIDLLADSLENDLDSVVYALISDNLFDDGQQKNDDVESGNKNLPSKERIEHLRNRYHYYVGKSKFKTSTVINSFFSVFKIWFQLLKSLRPSIYYQPTLAPYISTKWLADCLAFIEQAITGILRVFNFDIISDEFDWSVEMTRAFMEAQQSFFYIADEELTTSQRSILPRSKLILICSDFIKDFVFEGDHSHIDNIVELTTKLLEFASQEKNRKNTRNFSEFKFREYLPKYYQGDNTNIALFQEFAFNIAANDPTLTDAQKEIITKGKNILSIQRKLHNLSQVVIYYESECEKAAENTGFFAAKKTKQEFSRLTPLFKKLSDNDYNELSHFDEMKDRFVKVCAEYKNSDIKAVKKFSLEYIEKIVKLVLINDSDFFDVPPECMGMFSGGTKFRINDYIDLFHAIPAESESKLLLGNFIYSHLHRFSYQEQLEFLSLLVDLEVETKKTYELTQLAINSMLYTTKPIDAQPPNRSTTLKALIHKHNQVIENIYNTEWWQDWINWLYSFIFTPINYRQHRIAITSQSEPILPRLNQSNNHETEENRRTSPTNRRTSRTGTGSDIRKSPITVDTPFDRVHDQQSLAADTTAEKMHQLQPPPEKAAENLYHSILDSVRDLFLAAELLDAVEDHNCHSIVLGVGDKLISGNPLMNIYTTLQRLKAGTIIGLNRDHLYQSNITYVRRNRNDANELAEHLTNLIGSAVVRYIDDRKITVDDDTPLYQSDEFIALCAVYIEEQLKRSQSLSFGNLPYYETMLRLANHICVDLYDPDHEMEVFQHLQLFTGETYSPNLKMYIPAERRDEFHVKYNEKVEKASTDDDATYEVTLTPGDILARACRFYQPKHVEDFQTLMGNGLFQCLPSTDLSMRKNPTYIRRGRAGTSPRDRSGSMSGGLRSRAGSQEIPVDKSTTSQFG